MGDRFRILVAIDLQAGTPRLLDAAEQYGRAFDAVVDIVHVGDPDPFVGYIKSDDPGEQETIDSGRNARAKALRDAHQATHQAGEALRARGVQVDRALTLQGPILETILDQASRSGADLLVMGAQHHGMMYRLWHGDTAAAAAARAPCALLLIPV